jgi:hypothetical protein
MGMWNGMHADVDVALCNVRPCWHLHAATNSTQAFPTLLIHTFNQQSLLDRLPKHASLFGSLFDCT